jgi:hypothetical protein
VVEAERQFYHGIEPWETPVSRPHFLDHDSAVSAAEEVHHSVGQDSLREAIRNVPYGFGLSADAFNETSTFI